MKRARHLSAQIRGLQRRERRRHWSADGWSSRFKRLRHSLVELVSAGLRRWRSSGAHWRWRRDAPRRGGRRLRCSRARRPRTPGTARRHGAREMRARRLRGRARSARAGAAATRVIRLREWEVVVEFIILVVVVVVVVVVIIIGGGGGMLLAPPPAPRALDRPPKRGSASRRPPDGQHDVLDLALELLERERRPVVDDILPERLTHNARHTHKG